MEFPRNETFEHFALKNIGALYLKHNQLCNFVADEFGIERQFLFEAENQFDWKANPGILNKKVTDVLGFKASYYGESIIKSVEAKYSYSDFKNGFCIGGEYNYLIAPEGVIPVEEVPSFVGLVEIDFDKFKYTGYRLRGYNIKSRARKIKIEEETKNRVMKVLKWKMLYKLTVDKFSNHWLEGIDIKEEYGDRFGAGVMRDLNEGG